MMNHIYIGLIHSPVDCRGSVITSSITNLDIHDISRVAATYDLGGYFIVHPEESQRSLAQKLSGHWTDGKGKKYNPDRHKAFEKLSIVSSLDEAKLAIKKIEGVLPMVVGTSARKNDQNKSLEFLSKIEKKPVLILFGTAGGISSQLFDSIDFFLEPIDVGTGYNHLSVRSAVAIFIDRLSIRM